jgi:hypothetical protein
VQTTSAKSSVVKGGKNRIQGYSWHHQKNPMKHKSYFYEFFDPLAGRDRIWHPFVLKMRLRYGFIRQIDGSGER